MVLVSYEDNYNIIVILFWVTCRYVADQAKVENAVQAKVKNVFVTLIFWEDYWSCLKLGPMTLIE